MTQISKNKYCYIYGKFCGDLMVYLKPKCVTSKLEGFFVSSKKVISDEHRNGTLVEISEKENFEKKYNGKFIPFESD